MRVIPLIVIPCLLFSLVESLWILPAHLAHIGGGDGAAERSGLWYRIQGQVPRALSWFIKRVYEPTLHLALSWRYLTAAVGIATLLLTVGFVGAGWVRFIFFPPVEADFISAAVTMPLGTPVETTSEAVRVLETHAEQVRRQVEEETGKNVYQNTIATIGDQPYSSGSGGPHGNTAQRVSGAHLGEVFIELSPADGRPVGGAELADRWREQIGVIPEAVELTVSSTIFSPGADVDVQLTGSDIEELRAAAEALKRRLAEYTGVHEIADSFREGKREVKLGIKPAAELLGLTLTDLARQVRQAFYGEEAQRIQRGRDDLRVMVRYPEDERRSLGDLENMRIRTRDGQQVPFGEVAMVEPGRGYASIKRVDRRRAVNVTANVDSKLATPGDIIADLEARVLPDIRALHPGVLYSFEGQQAEQRDTLGGLLRGFVLALIMIYGLLAVPLRSYTHPIVIMSAIPFGLVGAVWGHMIMGMNLTILSMFGVVALAGVVVNDSLVMVHFINSGRQAGGALAVAVKQAGVARFRPILLTSLTTFLGLLPLLLEKSMQARFLVPMAVSLGFGVVFSTVISLMLVPAGYMIMEDLKGAARRVFRPARATGDEPGTQAPSVAGAEEAGRSV
jgi:multidrug efflux pump subunit AcrB